MNKRENLLAVMAGHAYSEVPVDFGLCPALEAQYYAHTGASVPYDQYYGFPWRGISSPVPTQTADFARYYPQGLAEGAQIDMWGAAHEPGSAAAFHMTRLRHPLTGNINADDIAAYPFPSFDPNDIAVQQRDVSRIHAEGLAAVGFMQMTIWETAWAIRSMEDLMADMMDEDQTAEALIARVTQTAVARAEIYAKSGADILYIGDDIGMQRSAMMSTALYKTWLWPAHKAVIEAARAINPDILVFYHSCGKVDSFIPLLIQAGIDVLNPVQPETMDFAALYQTYSDKLAFCGGIGTQSTMPNDTPDAVRRTVFERLDAANGGKKLFLTPTHLLEPDVPWANVEAYVRACKDYL